MSPSVIVAALNDIVINDRQAIVECGSGNSTIYIARLLAQRGAGHVTTIDHDSRWAGLTRQAVTRERLGEYATVIHAPLVDGWYEKQLLPTVHVIDLLVVDGPPAYLRDLRHSRAGALDHFSGSMTASSSVILDDARRRGERDVVKAWGKRYGRKFHRDRAGYAISAPHIA